MEERVPALVAGLSEDFLLVWLQIECQIKDFLLGWKLQQVQLM